MTTLLPRHLVAPHLEGRCASDNPTEGDDVNIILDLKAMAARLALALPRPAEEVLADIKLAQHLLESGRDADALRAAELLAGVGATRIVADSITYDLAQIHKTKGYQIYRSAENHLQMAVRRLGWTLELREGRQPMCPCCETVMPGYGHQTCHVCNRLMTFRAPDGPFCTGTVMTSPIHLGVAEHRPSHMPTQEWPSTAEAPASLWAASTALRGLQRTLEAK